MSNNNNNNNNKPCLVCVKSILKSVNKAGRPPSNSILQLPCGVEGVQRVERVSRYLLKREVN